VDLIDLVATCRTCPDGRSFGPSVWCRRRDALADAFVMIDGCPAGRFAAPARSRGRGSGPGVDLAAAAELCAGCRNEVIGDYGAPACRLIAAGRPCGWSKRIRAGGPWPAGCRQVDAGNGPGRDRVDPEP